MVMTMYLSKSFQGGLQALHESSLRIWNNSRADLVQAVTALAYKINSIPKANIPIHLLEKTHR